MTTITFDASDPENIEFTLSVRMPLRQWTSICNDLDAGSNRSDSYPLREAIRSCVRQASQRFKPALGESE